ncbi:hypothetical protein [Actinomadura sp. WMMB 499]|uniref:hypothetical protein n=1 Tax=Actinomadura sp. WMMB 499 TaxID=1219491 RepID=UPI001245BBAD|nr:hypothetical protein [Actinomadura sp. WMMB 499]QFG21170.1 hypothetical protein F7P10_08470 [Actinomadura sp. WMMB 499]
MGYDTSYHPVDMALVESRLLPYLAGHGSDDGIDDLVGRAVEIRKTRFRAKAWALGVLQATRGLDGVAFDPALHVWGRPFFIVGDGVAEDVRRYLATPSGEVDALAREMIDRIDPALTARVTPDAGGRLPDDERLAEGMTTALRILRGAAVALREGRRTVRHPDGREFDAAEILASEVPFNLLTFTAALLPGWMSRGRTWPTALCADAGVADEGFTGPAALTGLLREEFPGLDWPVPAGTITANYTVGGLVPAPAVAGTRAHLARHRDAFDRDPSDLRKIDEAMGVAAAFGAAFCEATEIYSGMEGDLN